MKSLDGFSLIELIVGMAIFGVLLALAMPSYSGWIRNAKIRTATESMQNGLQLARAEAVRRNTLVTFQLTNTLDSSCAVATSGQNWVVSRDNVAGKCDIAPSETISPRAIQSHNGTDNTGITTAGQAAFTFNGLGRLTTTPSTIDLSNSALACIIDGGPVRCLRVAVSLGGQIRMCDPALPTGDAQAC